MNLSTSEITKVDLINDFQELKFLYISFLNRLKTNYQLIAKKKNYIPDDLLPELMNQYHQSEKIFSREISQIQELLEKLLDTDGIRNNFSGFIEHKHRLSYNLRSQIGIISSLITATDWQSPSFKHSVMSEAGRQTGEISGNINDYKRDVHLDERDYESKYLREYIHTPMKFLVKTYLTNSGMAAFCTILNFLVMEEKTNGIVLAGLSTYFEAKELLSKTYGNRLVYVDESDTNGILNAYIRYQPNAIFLDSLCNAPEIPIPDFSTLVPKLIKNCQKDTYLILDNTGLSFYCQPFPLVIGKTRKLHVISYESLNKYHQFGCDRVTGGVITAYGKDTGKLYYYREHTGTNISDASVHALPEPSVKLLDCRMRRLGRNTQFLAINLSHFCTDNPKNPIERIIYPGLSNHSGYPAIKNLPFQGAYFTIRMKKRFRNQRYYKKLLSRIISIAKRKNVPLIAGTSFGLNTTRIYITALNNDYGEPFIRISPGTETKEEIEAIKKLLEESFKN